MTIWGDFEIKCTNYLNTRFGAYARFVHKGDSNSTVSDILVETKSGDSFYIDAKHSPAQCGQFVLFPDIKLGKFVYSDQNTNRINAHTQKIMEYMNADFDSFRNAGTAGKDIDIPNKDEIFSNWVIKTYSEKGVRYFITNDYIILPIEHFKQYFEITAKYRIKRSGSSAVGKKRIKDVLSFVKNNYRIDNYRVDGDKLFTVSRYPLHNKRFSLRSYEYMFSRRGTEYEIRKLSNTCNANVIFSIRLKPGIPGMSDADFKSALT